MIGLAEWDEEVFAALERMTEFGPRMLRNLLALGVEQGELVSTTDVDLLADRLIGPCICGACCLMMCSQTTTSRGSLWIRSYLIFQIVVNELHPSFTVVPIVP